MSKKKNKTLFTIEIDEDSGPKTLNIFYDSTTLSENMLYEILSSFTAQLKHQINNSDSNNRRNIN